MRPLLLDLLFNDDRMFVLSIAPAERMEFGGSEKFEGVMTWPGRRSLSTSKDAVWAVTTRRNVIGYPPVRTDTFLTEAEALSFYQQIVVTTPRKSLGEKPPDPLPTLEQYVAWLRMEKLRDPLLTPELE